MLISWPGEIGANSDRNIKHTFWNKLFQIWQFNSDLGFSDQRRFCGNAQNFVIWRGLIQNSPVNSLKVGGNWVSYKRPPIYHHAHATKSSGIMPTSYSSQTSSASSSLASRASMYIWVSIWRSCRDARSVAWPETTVFMQKR